MNQKQSVYFLAAALFYAAIVQAATTSESYPLTSFSSSSSSSSPRAISIDELMQRKQNFAEDIKAEITDWRENGECNCCRKRPWQIASNACLKLACLFYLGMNGICLDAGERCEPCMAGSIMAGLVFSSAAHGVIECYNIAPKSIAEEKKAELANICDEIARLENEQAEEELYTIKAWKKNKQQKLLEKKSE